MTEKSERGGVLGDFSLSQLLAQSSAAYLLQRRPSRSRRRSASPGRSSAPSWAPSPPRWRRRSIATSSPRPAEKLRALGGADETRAVGSVSGRAAVEEVAASGTPIAPPEVRHAAHERGQRRIRRRVALLAAAAGVVAVLAYALVVNLATQGAGIGAKPQVAAPTAEEQPSQAQTEPQSPAAGAADGVRSGAPRRSLDLRPATTRTTQRSPPLRARTTPLGDDALSEDEGVESDEEGTGSEETPEDAPSDATSEPTGTVEGPDPAQK